MSSARDDARFLNLQLEPKSEKARQFVEDVAEQTWSTVGKKRKRPGKTHLAACGAFIGDLLKIAEEDHKRLAYRQMNAGSFTGERIGFHTFKQVVDACKKVGLVEVRTGNGGGTAVGVATRFRATAKFFAKAESYGIEPCNWSDHFASVPRPKQIASPVVLKSGSTMIKNKKVHGSRMQFDPDEPKPKKLIEQVNDINAFFADVQIEPDGTHCAFQRIFSQGDLVGSNWNKGGRLYSIGDSYQNGPKRKRKNIRLNAEATVELDICASFLTVLHGLKGILFDPAARDLYDHPDIPRDVVKAWVVMTLGHDRFHEKWTQGKGEEYAETHGRKLGKDYPIKKVREEALKLLPILKDWETSTVRWGDLQYAESCAVVDTVHQLAMQHGAPALPVHDSIIVPKSQEKLATLVSKENFKKHVGVEPAITSK